MGAGEWLRLIKAVQETMRAYKAAVPDPICSNPNCPLGLHKPVAERPPLVPRVIAEAVERAERDARD
jgi:hypothetical protein